MRKLLKQLYHCFKFSTQFCKNRSCVREACHTVYTIKYARKDHRSNSKDIKTKGIKGQRKKGEIEINTNKYLGNIN